MLGRPLSRHRRAIVILSTSTKTCFAIGLTAEFVGVVMAKKDLPVNSMQEFIAYAKENPGKLNFGTSGLGSMVHLERLLVHLLTGLSSTRMRQATA
jgi:tripartite-type tricarboxylate transporter receptor subunit TctC